MPSSDDLVHLADESLFIFTGSVTQAGASTVASLKADNSTLVISVHDVIKTPPGVRGFAGREVTLRAQQPMREGDYLFFADPLAVGEGIALRERGRLATTERARVQAAVEAGYARLIARRAENASFVVLAEVGPVRPLFPPTQWRKQIPWAVAPLRVERELAAERPRRAVKDKAKHRDLTLVGPVRASKRIPRAPALRAGLKAIFILHRPPPDAIEHIPEGDRESAVFIADTSDIQPPDRESAIERIVRRQEQR